MEKTCKHCGKLFVVNINKLGLPVARQVYCSTSCCSKWRYRNNENVRIRKIRASRRWEKNNPEKAFEKKKKALENFRKRTPERFNELMVNGYKRNKDRWRERKFTFTKRKEIIKILGNKCFNCGEIGIKEIHHKEYGNRPKLFMGPGAKEKNKILLKEYTNKYLVGVCSKKCHQILKNENKN